MSKGSKASLEEEISGLAAKIPSLLPHIQTEEATKNAIIWPLLRILGYDPFDPREIVPEYPAPPGSKLGKKVDIAIIDSGKPSVIWECKWSGKELEVKDEDQLREYFPFIDSVHLAVLTNGKKFLFFADGDKPNIMDQAPFFEVDFLNLKNQDLELLARFQKGSFKGEQILEWASSRSFVQRTKDILLKEFGNPSEDFVKLVVKQMSDIGRVGSKMLELYTRRVERSIRELLTEKTGLACLELPVIRETSPELSKEDGRGMDSLEARNEELAKEAALSAQKARDLEHRLAQLRTVLSEILVASGLKLSKQQEDIVSLVDKGDGSLLCNIYFDSISKELGFIDESAPNQRIGLQQFTRPPERINSLLKLLDVSGAFGNSRIQDPSEPPTG